MIAVEDGSFRRQARKELNQRGAAVLREVDRKTGDQRHAHETYVRLLAHTPGLPGAVHRRESARLARMLRPTMATPAFEEVTIYDTDAAEIVHLGPPKGDRVDAALFAGGIARRTTSDAAVDAAGLAVLAATPVTRGRRVVGGLPWPK